ncbi:monothiol glutaredoxin-S7, chloroplastic isoform X1 [Sesamum indicum]|uniref:Monothiol glutaredoxin-S7, chloroplastic isoform X1 n=1 Tax=Sesamum indicum TaxID=4182 RepID=A0A6I9UJ93_SESIN|nr:monothiol glutaredoxin-S7, chloroplastic isoform X1 [Sesamum indicum]
MALRLQIVALNNCSPVATPILAPFSRLRPHQNHRLPNCTTTTGMKANSSRLDSTGRKTSSFRCYSALTPELKTTLDKVVTSHKVVVFIKGTKEFPQCGFSNTVVQILKSLNVPFETINILENEMLRQGLKEYSSWPTFPQLYIDGDFFGGCDITVEAYKSGELQEVLEKAICS